MSNVNLAEMDMANLLELDARIAEEMKNRQSVVRTQIAEETFAKLAAAGLSFKEVFGVHLPGGRVRRLPAAYRNPQNPAQTWTGRGRRPDWVTLELSKGVTLESLRA